MNSDLRAINRFLESVSWAHQCVVLERADGRHRLLAPCFVLVPSRWSDWRDHLPECRRLGRKYGTQPGTEKSRRPGPGA